MCNLMKMRLKSLAILSIVIFVITSFISCKKIEEFNQDPELTPLQHGFKVSSAIGYSASLAYTYFKNKDLPDNVIIHSQNNDQDTKAGILLVNINDSYPLPFNNSVGQITIAGTWGNTGGVITVLFTDISIIRSRYKFIGIYTIPIIEMENGEIMTVFAEQDIVFGEGSDTLLNISLTNPQIKIETDRLNERKPEDTFIAAKQNVWFVLVNQDFPSAYIYNDEYTIYGGGQIVKAKSNTGGILYHAIIGAKFRYTQCDFNPYEGVGFIQNLMVGEEIDLGHIFLNFHERCDGKAYVELSTGKYLTSIHKNVNLNLR